MKKLKAENRCIRDFMNEKKILSNERKDAHFALDYLSGKPL